MTAPTGIPIEDQGRGTFLVKNQSQLKSADYKDDPLSQSTQKQSDFVGGHSLTPEKYRIPAFIQAPLEVPNLTWVSASINVAGTQLTVVFSHAVRGSAGFALTLGGAANALTYVSGQGTASLVFSLAVTATIGQVATLNYVPGTVTDMFDNAIAAFYSAAVTNNSTVP